MPPLPAGNARAAAALSTEGAATAGTGEAAAAASGAEGPAPADGAGAGAAGVAVSSTATWPESTSSQLTWTGDGDPAESTARTTPFPANGLAGSAQSRPMAVRSNVHVPSAARTPSAEPGLQSAVGRSRQAAFWPGPQGAVAAPATP